MMLRNKRQLGGSSLLSCLIVTVALAISGTNGQGTNVTNDLPIFNAAHTLSIGYVVFPGWQPLDVFGPLELLFSLSLSSQQKMTLSVISKTTGPISARVPRFRAPSGEIKDLDYLIGPSVEATNTYLDAPAIDVLFVPGGLGTIPLYQANDTWVEDFINSRIEQLDYIASQVILGEDCSPRRRHPVGAECKMSGRWKSVDKFWGLGWLMKHKMRDMLTRGAGLDMTYALLKRWYGLEKANKMVNGIEYVPHTDPTWDPFSVIHNVPGANSNGSFEDCGAPVGYK
ncbi:hypothetical protein GX50_01576 [[Emmonsia] crescens]|uniref:DJ-1/PfpI domain-containing protein n=1 Tax=[Emmonsia] crescens TaxID=73230 RepID=A0A2B7ZPM1_9EURO|nr:hypothetical protein GX50_01576 [Emmonsia crescens]